MFTQGVGLDTWQRAGFSAREIDYYKDVAVALGSVTFLTYDKSDPRQLAGLPTLDPIQVEFNSMRLDRRFFSLLAPIFKYRALKKSDVIKTTQHRGSWTALLLKWVLRKPMLARCGYVWSLFEARGGASKFRMRIIKFLEGFVLRRADAIAVPDRFAVNYLSSLHGIEENKFTVLPNFVDVEQFVPGDAASRNRDQFVFVGRLESDQKRPELAIGAAGLVPNARLDMVGDGPDREKIESLTNAVNNVKLLGQLSHADVSEIMSTALAFVITSRYEGNPKVVIEALSAGLPVIATKAQGLSEIVEDGVNGFLVDADPESIASAMRRLMDDPQLWQKLSERSRQTAMDNYSRTSVLKREVSLLTKLIDG